MCRGQKIGLADNTGLTLGPHLHFEYAPNGFLSDNRAKVDPVPFLDTQPGFSPAGKWRGATNLVVMGLMGRGGVTIDQTIEAQNVVLENLPNNCSLLVAKSGTVRVSRTDTYTTNAGQTCTITYSGTGAIDGTNTFSRPSVWAGFARWRQLWRWVHHNDSGHTYSLV